MNGAHKPDGWMMTKMQPLSTKDGTKSYTSVIINHSHKNYNGSFLQSGGTQFPPIRMNQTS